MHTDAITEQVAIAYVVARVIECLKRSQWFPWINEHSDELNGLLSRLLALATSAGLTWAWSGSAEAGWTFTLAIPSANSLIEFLAHAIFSFASQEMIYRGAIKGRAQ